jgi:hypothetical protein
MKGERKKETEKYKERGQGRQKEKKVHHHCW